MVIFAVNAHKRDLSSTLACSSLFQKREESCSFQMQVDRYSSFLIKEMHFWTVPIVKIKR
jgi:hypothetical protein